MKTHNEASHLAAFQNIAYLSLSTTQGYFEDRDVDLLPRFWARFTQLNEVSIRKVRLNRLKARGVDFWERVRKDCPKLKTVSCNWSVNLNVDELVRDDWPDFVDNCS